MSKFLELKRIIQIGGKYVSEKRPHCLVVVMDNLRYGRDTCVAETHDGKVDIPFFRGCATEWDGERIKHSDGINRVLVIYEKESIELAFNSIIQNEPGKRFAVIFPDKIIHARDDHVSILDKSYY